MLQSKSLLTYRAGCITSSLQLQPVLLLPCPLTKYLHPEKFNFKMIEKINWTAHEAKTKKSNDSIKLIFLHPQSPIQECAWNMTRWLKIIDMLDISELDCRFTDHFHFFKSSVVVLNRTNDISFCKPHFLCFNIIEAQWILRSRFIFKQLTQYLQHIGSNQPHKLCFGF